MSILMRYYAALIAALTCASAHRWESFKTQHHKHYPTSQEEAFRREVYNRNRNAISWHNTLYYLGLSTYSQAMNRFGDLTDEEFETLYLSDSSSFGGSGSSTEDGLPEDVQDYVPTSIDWRLLGAVTNVKTQGPCGSCYAFSALGALEAQRYLFTKTLNSLSVQNIIDCTYMRSPYDNKGCKGGLVESTYRYIIDNGGVESDESYPYTATEDSCKFNRTDVSAVMSKFVRLPKGDEKALRLAVSRIGPISVTVDGQGMRFYSGGLYDDRKCSQKRTHGMLIVGYGSWRGIGYWLVKNSWGQQWGERGYIMMARNKGNQCGIASDAIYPLL